MKTLLNSKIILIFFLFYALVAQANLVYSNDRIPADLIGSWCLDSSNSKLLEILTISPDGHFTSVEFNEDNSEQTPSQGIIQIFDKRERSWVENMISIVYLGLFSNSNSVLNVYDSTEAGFGVRNGKLEIQIPSLKQHERIYRKCTEAEKDLVASIN